MGISFGGDGVYICCLLGNRDTPREVLPTLHFVLLDLIENKEVSLFYVGNQTVFDRMVQRELKMLELEYPHIGYLIVLAYMPGRKNGEEDVDEYKTIYPDGIENTPPRYAIRKRNEWMIKRADYVVTYAGRTFGYTAQFQKLAKRKNKVVINLAERMASADGDR